MTEHGYSGVLSTPPTHSAACECGFSVSGESAQDVERLLNEHLAQEMATADENLDSALDDVQKGFDKL